MVLMGYSSLLGMVQHHVITMGAMLVCSLLLTPVQSASQAEALKLLAADEAQAEHTKPSSHLHQHLHYSALPVLPSPSPSNNNNNGLSHSRAGPNVLEKEPSASAGNHVKSNEAEAETEDGSGPNKPMAPAFDLEKWKRMYGGEIPPDAFTKRFLQGFVGSRGKRAVDEGAGAFDPWQGMYDGELASDALAKRFSQAFVGSRGRRGGMEEEEVEEVPRAERFFPLLYGREQKRATGVSGRAVQRRWFNPASFTASRGKRYMPGLEALLLSQMYKKWDAEKWKRQSMLGFHAARG